MRAERGRLLKGFKKKKALRRAFFPYMRFLRPDLAPCSDHNELRGRDFAARNVISSSFNETTVAGKFSRMVAHRIVQFRAEYRRFAKISITLRSRVAFYVRKKSILEDCDLISRGSLRVSPFQFSTMFPSAQLVSSS